MKIDFDNKVLMRPSSKPPRFENFEILSETAKHWRANAASENDVLINMQCHEAALKIATVVFEETYRYFESFLRDVGVSDTEQAYFRHCVYGELIKNGFLNREDALVEAITTVLECFYADRGALIKLVKSLENEYNLIVEYGGLDILRISMQSWSDLPDLITRILMSRKLIST